MSHARAVFKYIKGNHSVVEATAAGFAACSAANSLATWASGDDRVPLSAPGQRWFFSGVGKDCVQGMRFNFTVLPVVKLSPSPSSSLPPPPSSSSAPRSSGGSGLAPVLGIAFNRVTDDEPLEMYAPWFFVI